VVTFDEWFFSCVHSTGRGIEESRNLTFDELLGLATAARRQRAGGTLELSSAIAAAVSPLVNKDNADVWGDLASHLRAIASGEHI
jgi:hypothetical protein